MSDPKYKMTIGLNVLNHLGLNLYSNVPAVLSEVIANSYDADATEVIIKISEDKIIIKDNGRGMTVDDINSKYLYVGYEKRKTKPGDSDSEVLITDDEENKYVTPIYKRPVMGRKGIGKLSLFSIANNIEIHSVRNGDKNGLTLNKYKIQEKIKDDQLIDYHPDEIPLDSFEIDKGTTIIITDFKKNINKTEKFLRQRLARRFSIIGEEYNFKIVVDENEITIDDRNYFNKLQFLWLVGDEKDVSEKFSNIKNVAKLEGKIKNTNYLIKGWIGTVSKPSQLIEDEINNNKVSIISRGKVSQEDILEAYTEGGIYADYLIGEINADFLDVDNKEDIATSSRQKIFEDEERYQILSKHVYSNLKDIQSAWTDLRKKHTTKKVLGENPIIKKWYDRLKPDTKIQAEKLFATIETLHFDKNEERSKKNELYKQGILAFERLRLRDNLQLIDKLETSADVRFATIFADLQDVEAVLYYDIAKERVRIIRDLQKTVDDNEKEKVIQKYLFDNLWLLSASWERATKGSELMEKRVYEEFDEITEALGDEEKKGRVDIKYRTASGKHIIIELKRYHPSYKISLSRLTEQVDKYINGLHKCLVAAGKGSESIEVIIVLGKPLEEDSQLVKNQLALRNARIIYYDYLIEEALQSYNDYLDAEKEVGELKSILDELDEESKNVKN